VSPKSKALGERVLHAISHPLKIEIQRILCHRTASPNEVARELKVEVPAIAHHFRALEAESCIQLEREEARRGAIEHFYRAIFPAKHDGESWAALPRGAREDISRLTLQSLLGEAVRALNERTFDELMGRHLSWVPLTLDEPGFLNLIERQAKWLHGIEEIRAQAAARLGDQEGHRAIGAILGFKTPPGCGLEQEPSQSMVPPAARPLGAASKSPGERVIDALLHPLRIEIQRILIYRVASPKEVATELNTHIGIVSHHFKALEAGGYIRLVETKSRRGAIQHLYKAICPSKHDDESWSALPRSTREELTRLTLQGLFGEAVRALNEGTFDECKERHFSWVPMALDAQGFLDLFGRQARWLEEIEEVQAEAAARLNGQKGHRVIGATLGFATPPGFGLKPKSRYAS
jgi:predicted ArsR family transcriptional regulator